MSEPKVEIIIVKYGLPDFEAITMHAVAAHTQDVPGYNLTMYENAPGRSLAACWNQLIDRSEADYICLLNNDTAPARGWLSKLIKILQAYPEAGAVVPSSNKVYLSQVDTPLERYTTNFTEINNFGAQLATSKQDHIRELPTLSATCVVFPKAVWTDLKGFHEEFMLYGEDSDFFWRVKNILSKKLLWVQDAYVHHYKGQSVNKAVMGGMDIKKILRDSEKLVNQRTDLQIRHG